ALGYERDLLAGAAAFRSKRIGGFAAEFLDGVDGRVRGGGKGLAGAEVVDIQTVERDVALVDARSGDRAGAAVVGIIDAGRDCHARLKLGQRRDRVTELNGQVVHFPDIKVVSDGRVRRVERHGGTNAAYFHGLSR